MPRACAVEPTVLPLTLQLHYAWTRAVGRPFQKFTENGQTYTYAQASVTGIADHAFHLFLIPERDHVCISESTAPLLLIQPRTRRQRDRLADRLHCHFWQ